MKELFVSLFIQAKKTAPRRLILDLDATDDPVHGNQEDRFFHGYYKCYCYLPLYIFCGRDAARQAPASKHRCFSRLQGGNRLDRSPAQAEMAGC
jgi:hypothetical protein